jgi:hypothetical protein
MFVLAVDTHQMAYVYASVKVMRSLHMPSRCCAKNIYLVWFPSMGTLDVVAGVAVLETIGAVPITMSLLS